ncbi:MAG: 50S ribosomal protein L28 [Sandaracinaceae bacterium]
MARVCQVKGTRPRTGNRVSHSHRKSKRRLLPNLQVKRVWDPETGRFVKLKLTTRALREIDKRGAAVVLREMRAQGKKV